MIAWCAIALFGCQSHPAAVKNVVIVVVDTLRADRLGRYGNMRGLTPFLDQLADRGVRFDHAYANASWTMPSVASLLTSRYPSQHGVHDFDSRLSDDEVTFAERLSQAGYVGGGFTANFRLAADLGYAQGFAAWQGFAESPNSPTKARASVVRDAVFNWVDRTSSSAPRLLYVQIMEPHAPYQPPADLRARLLPAISAEEAARVDDKALLMTEPLTPTELTILTGMYDAEVAAADAELRQVFDGLAQRGFLDDALVIVTGDHGEELMEHGELGHGFDLFNETVHVPLLISGPGVPAGRVVGQNVSLVDLAPTLLELLGLPPEPRFEGRSLAGMLRAATPAVVMSDIILQLPRNNAPADARDHREGLVRGTDKLLVEPDGSARVYDLANDPGELAGKPPPATAALSLGLEQANAALAARERHEVGTAPLDDATKEKLRALGYER